jgi:alkylhydroperoxidase/carboxymuconolactone decarboxylase family protein YurZ
MTARSLSAALATGNACVIKSPELDAAHQRWFARAARPLAFQGRSQRPVVLAMRPALRLRRIPDVNQIVFTGSVPTGIAIATAAAQNVVPCVLELGGKSAAIVHDDADLEAFENDIRWGIYFNAGQVCSAMSRVIVHESHDEVVERAENGEIAFGRAGHRAPRVRRQHGRHGLSETARPRRRMVRDGAGERRARRNRRRPRQLNRTGAFLEPTVLRPGHAGDGDRADKRFSARSCRSSSSATTRRPSRSPMAPTTGWSAGVFTADLDRATRGAAAARRAGLRQRMVCRRRRNAVRRLRQIGLRPGKGARGAVELCADQEHRHQIGAADDHDDDSFDEDLFLKGLEQRKATLGADYVEKNLAAADDFTRPFQEAMTAWCWGFGWGDDVIDAKTRSMMNLAMIGAWARCRMGNPLPRRAQQRRQPKEEIRAIIHVVGIYCGVPQALECFRVRERFWRSRASYRIIRRRR